MLAICLQEVLWYSSKNDEVYKYVYVPVTQEVDRLTKSKLGKTHARIELKQRPSNM